MKVQYMPFFPNEADRFLSASGLLHGAGQISIITFFLLLVSFSGITATPSGFSGWCDEGAKQEAKGNWDKALAAYKKAVKLKPGSQKAGAGLARSAKGALQKRPKEKVLQNTYIDAVRNSGDKEDLKKALEHVIRGDLKAHTFRFTLAGLLAAKGDSARAYQQYKKAYKSSPNNKKYQKKLLGMLDTDNRITENFLLLRNLAYQKGASLETKLLYARGCVKKNSLTEAWKVYKITYQKNKRLLRGNSDAIRIFFWKKQYDIARELADAYLREFPQDVKVRDIQIKCYKIQKASDTQIRRALQEMVKYNPKTKKWWLQLAKLDIAAGDADAALKHAKIWVERNSRSKQGYAFLLPLVVRNPDERDTYQNALEKLIELEPRRSIDRRKTLGLLKFENERYREAEKLLAQSVRLFPKDHEVWYALGMSRLKLNIEGKSKFAFGRAYKLAPDSIKYARVYGKYLETDQAIKAHFKLFQLLEQNSPSITEQIKITKSYSLNGSNKAAGQTWKKLVDKDPLFLVSHPEAVVPMISAGYLSLILKNYQNYQNSFEVNFALGKKLGEMGQRKEALGYLITSYQLNPSSLKVLLLIARLKGELKKYSQGLDAYVHALALRPKSTDIQEKAINLAQQSGDWVNMQKICEVIISKDPRAHKAHFLMAKAYLMQDNNGLAARSLTRAIQLQPSNREYKALQEQIP